jgi:hypothetical protein
LEFDVASFNKDFFGQSDLSIAPSLIFGEQRHCDLRVLNSFNDHFNRLKNSHCSGSMDVEVLPDLILKDIEVDVIFVSSSGNTNYITEVIDSFSRITSSSHTVDSQNSWIIPTSDSVRENELVKFSLRKDIVCNVQTRVLPNVGFVKIKPVQDPVIKLPSDFKLK